MVFVIYDKVFAPPQRAPLSREEGRDKREINSECQREAARSGLTPWYLIERMSIMLCVVGMLSSSKPDGR